MTPPFPKGRLLTGLRFFNGDASPYDVANAVLFGERGFPGDLRSLRAYLPEPSDRVVFSGRAAKLMQWQDGDRIALDTTSFGSPYPNFNSITCFRDAYNGPNLFSDCFPNGLISSLSEAVRFDDVPSGYWAYESIEALALAGVTIGCGVRIYCPESMVTRAQMAIFLLRAINGGGFVPPAPLGTVFSDVPAHGFAAAFIEELAALGITSGCGGGQYCPNNPVTRAQMAVFLLRATHGAGYVPPPPSGVFADVPPVHWAAAWIEQLAAQGITLGCGAGNYCPGDAVTRAQMAVFLGRAFEL